MKTALFPGSDSHSLHSSSLHQIHNRYEGKDISNHKRNLVIAGGVTLSVIVSPVVAAVTVGQSETLTAPLTVAFQGSLNCRAHIKLVFVPIMKVIANCRIK